MGSSRYWCLDIVKQRFWLRHTINNRLVKVESRSNLRLGNCLGWGLLAAMAIDVDLIDGKGFHASCWEWLFLLMGRRGFR